MNAFPPGLQAEGILSELGDFSREENRFKRLARQGQPLSTSKFICHIAQDNIKVIPDIERNGYNFSDGCGNMSKELALVIAKKFKMSCTSAVQIRMGGVKGVLAVKPSLQGLSVELRPSMIKFDASGDTALNVIRNATYSQANLNRQYIVLLSALGAPKKYFFDKVKNFTASLDVANVLSQFSYSQIEQKVKVEIENVKA